MSSEAGFSLSSAIQGFSLQPISTGAQSVLQDLAPLLSTDSTLDANVTKELRKTLERIVHATELSFAAGRHTELALIELCRTLRTWDKYPPSLKISSLLMLCKGFQYGLANAKDAIASYAELRRDVEAIFERFLDSYGSEAVVEVTSTREYTGELNFKKFSIQTLGTNTIWHLNQSESAASSLVDLLSGINNLLRSFLQDEKISVTQSLVTIPVWSENPVEVWSALESYTVRFSVQLSAIINQYNTWFKWTTQQASRLLQKDRETRLSQLSLPTIKLQVPKDEDAPTFKPKWPYTEVPSQVLQVPLKTSGYCKIKLVAIERIGSDVSIMKLSFDIRGPVGRSFDRIVIVCQPDSDETPVRIVDHNPKTLADLRSESQPKGKRTKAQLSVSTTPEMVEWQISQPLLRLSTLVLPTSFDISLNLEYPVEAAIDLRLKFVYRRRIFWREVVDRHVTVYIGRGTSSETNEAVVA